MHTTFSGFSSDVQPIWFPTGASNAPLQADGSKFRRYVPSALAQPEKFKTNDRFALERANDLAGFAAGAFVACPGGERPVEDLEIGDLVNTLDHGPRPIRWIGMSPIEAVGDFAPVRFSTGAFGARRALDVGPHQRIHLATPMMDLLFGFPEGLAAAKYLVERPMVTPIESGEAEYFQILFDEHEIIWANGVATESLFLDEVDHNSVLSGGPAGIGHLFPELANKLPTQNQTVRPVLEGFEARLVLSYQKSPSDKVSPF